MGASQSSSSAAHADSADLVAPLVSVDEGPLLPVNPGIGLTSAEVEARFEEEREHFVLLRQPRSLSVHPLRVPTQTPLRVPSP